MRRWPNCLRLNLLGLHLLCSCCSCCILGYTGVRVDVELLARLSCQLDLFFLLPYNRHAPFLLSLTGFNGKSDHFFLFCGKLVFLFFVLASLSLFFFGSNS